MGRVSQEQADRNEVTLGELETLALGKDCPTYPGALLHVRKVRGGKLVVFNVSEQARGESISATKQSRKRQTVGDYSGPTNVIPIAAKSN